MRAAVIPTHDRAEDFADCVAAIRPQVDLVIAVAHGLTAEMYVADTPGIDRVVIYNADLPNISTMWRRGLNVATQEGAHWTAVLNDDAIVLPGWFDTLTYEAERLHAAGASGIRAPGVVKIAGYAFILDNASGVMPDERFAWWYSDDAIQRRCDSHSWFHISHNVTVEHRHPNETTVGRLREISRADRARFQQSYPAPTTHTDRSMR